LVKKEGDRRERLFALIKRFRLGAEQLGLPLMPSKTAIQPILLGKEDAALAASEVLLQAGMLVSAIRPPTVPVGTARLRITLSAAHSDDDVDRLLHALEKLPRVAV
jgi:8-amino-7-oxononanoate synthase